MPDAKRPNEPGQGLRSTTPYFHGIHMDYGLSLSWAEDAGNAAPPWTELPNGASTNNINKCRGHCNAGLSPHIFRSRPMADGADARPGRLRPY
ncbi:MAG: hypothetical protein P8Z69_09230, partial [Acidihalobacter sp.]